MSRLIDENRFIEAMAQAEIDVGAGVNVARMIDTVTFKALEGTPTAKTLYSHWKRIDSDTFECRSCGHQTSRNTPFCPMCGAKMETIERKEEDATD